MPLTTEQTQKLTRIQNYATRYEVVIKRAGEEKLLCYTPRKNRTGLLAAIQQSGQALINTYGLDDSTYMTWNGDSKSPAYRVGADLDVFFTGRTQREAIIAGEHSFYAATEITAPLHAEASASNRLDIFAFEDALA